MSDGGHGGAGHGHGHGRGHVDGDAACSKGHGLYFVAITPAGVQSYVVNDDVSVISPDELCFSSHDHDGPCCGDETKHVHAHLFKSDCAAGKRGGDLTAHQITLRAESVCPSESAAEGAAEDACEVSIAAQAFPCQCGTDECGHRSITHGDHVDYLVPAGNGKLALHHACKKQAVSHCHVHGTLRPLQEITDAIAWYVFEKCPVCPTAKVVDELVSAGERSHGP